MPDSASEYVVDTCIFNWLLDGRISSDQLPQGKYIASHVQLDELAATPNSHRREALISLFATAVDELVSTESALVGISKVGKCKISDGVLLHALRASLDSLNGGKANNWKDALIAEVAIVGGDTLITADRDLAQVAKNHGCSVLPIIGRDRRTA